MTIPFQYDFAALNHYIDLLRTNLRIAVVYGGDSSRPGSVIYKTHNARAWKSYEAVARDIQRALQELGFTYVILLPDDMHLPQRLAHEDIHLVWLNTGGVQGYNPVSHAPAMLEMLGIPYIGHSPLNAALLDSKDAFKRSLQALGIRTAPFITWHPAGGALVSQHDRRFVAAFGAYSGPFVVKPVSGRASLHVHVVDSWDAVAQVANEVYRVTHNNVLIEAYIPGREFCVAVCGPVICTNGSIVRHHAPVAFSAVERILEADELIFTSMDQKPITTDRFRLLDATEPQLTTALLELAQTIYSAFTLQSIVRVDVRADAEGHLYVLEANPKPDLKRPTDHATSLVMAGLPPGDVSYHDLILGLFADRINTLLAYECDTAGHIVELFSRTQRTSGPVGALPRRTVKRHGAAAHSVDAAFAA